MKKKKKRMLSIAGMCCCGFLAAATAISGSSAYQTDHDEVVNIIRTGNNTIIPDEDFPTPTPVPSSGSVVKKVRAKNTGDVPCYVRAYITCSEPVKEFTGLDTTNWVKGNDGYYYYKKAVPVGGTTTYLFTGVTVADEYEQDNLEVTVYEESVQTTDGQKEYTSYQDAWKRYGKSLCRTERGNCSSFPDHFENSENHKLRRNLLYPGENHLFRRGSGLRVKH